MFGNRYFFYLLKYNDNLYSIIFRMFYGKITLPMVVLKLNLCNSIDGLERQGCFIITSILLEF